MLTRSSLAWFVHVLYCQLPSINCVCLQLSESLLLLANVTPEGPARDALHERVKALGVDFSDDGSEDES